MNLPVYISVTSFNKSDDFRKRHKMIDEIPKVDYRYLQYDLGWQYNPVTVSQYALCLYDEYRTENNETKKNRFLKAVEWLSDYKVMINDHAASLPYYFPNNMYALEAPWYSGMAQGQAVSVFLRAYELTDNDHFIAYAEEILNFMLLSIEEGGTLVRTPEGLPWIEECTTKEPSLILNGHLYALIGLAEYLKLTNNKSYRDIYEELIRSTIQLIPLYEEDNWLLYARKYSRKKCTNKYMGLQVLEAKQLYELTGIPEFHSIWKRWDSFTDWPAFWHDVKAQNTRAFYFFRNLKGIFKSIFPVLYGKYKSKRV